VKLGAHLKEKCLCISVTLHSFESKLFAYYSCCQTFESVMSLLTLAIVDLFASVGLTHYNRY